MKKPTPPQVDPGQMVRGVQGGLGEDGKTGGLQFKRANGTTTNLQFPMEQAAGLLLGIEQQLGQMFERQRQMMPKGIDPRAWFPMSAKRVSNIQGAVGKDGTPVLSLVLSTGVRLDLALDQKSVRDLAAWLETLAEESQKVQSAAPRKPS
jgi:hypothetical protein